MRAPLLSFHIFSFLFFHELTGALRTGQDTYTWNQSTISQSTVHDLLAGATGTGGKQLVPADLSRALGALRVHSKATNPQYTDNLINKFVGSTKYVFTCI